MPTRSGGRIARQLQGFEGVTAIYARISEAPDVGDDQDHAESGGVTRQLIDCRALAARRQWSNTKEFVDDDISASKYSRKRRPAYRDMLERVRAGEVTRIVCYHLDRLYRQPKELEELIELVEDGRVEVVTVYSGDVDLSNSDGVFVARILVNVAAKSSDDTSRRLRRTWDAYRADGRQKPGRRAFGWVDKKTSDPIEAAAIVDGIDRVLAGEALVDVARAWNKHGLRPPTAPLWSTSAVKVVLTNPRHIGLLTHNGDVIGDGDWKPIIDRDRFERAGAVIASRQLTRRGAPRADYWLTGVVFCGRCGLTLYHRDRQRLGRVGVCAQRPDVDGVGTVGCALSVRAERLEATVQTALFEHVDEMTLVDLAVQPGGQDSEIVLELATIEARQAELGGLFAGGLNARAFKSASEDLDKKAAALRKRLEGVRVGNVLGAYVGHRRALARAWHDEQSPLPPSRKREIVVAALGRVTVNSHPEDVPRARWTPERVQYGNPAEEPNARS